MQSEIDSSVSLETPVQAPIVNGARTISPVAVNGRFRVHKTTGVQRYANELLSRFGDGVRVVEPRAKLKGMKGHAWEQFALPWAAGSDLLWSPCNTGPRWYKRQVVTLHDMFPLDYPEWFSPAFIKAFNLIVPPLIGNSRRIIAVSQYTKNRVVAHSGVSPDKVSVVHSGVGDQFRPQSADAIAAARRAIGLPSGNYLLSVSSLEPRKNVKRILAAWEGILPEIPGDTWLVLAGGTGSDSVFAGLNIRRVPERVLLPGYLEERYLPALYAGATAFVFPSLAEGFGFPPLEAMACGTPVLCAENSSLLEVAGPAAILVDPTDATQIAREMRNLINDSYLRQILRDRGFSQARKFTWDLSAQKTWDILEAEQQALHRETGRAQ